MKHVQFKALPTMVGSFPHTDVDRLVDHIFEKLSHMPVWPQLPIRDFRESMYIQYSEGFPGVVLESTRQRMYFKADEKFYEELENFYQAVVEEKVEHFAISKDYAFGLHCFIEKLRGRNKVNWLKGQVTGPFSFAMTITDENKRSIAYNPELFEVAVLGIAMKARWMVRTLKELSDNVLVVLDEPYLCSFGSAFVNVPREEVITAVNGAVAAIHKEGGIAGIHCCGNTDWSLPLSTDAEVINLDAYEFFHGLPLYPQEVKSFLNRGGNIAWGIVPASDIAQSLDANTILKAFDERVFQLVAKGIDRKQILLQSLLTPSCGVGTKNIEVAECVSNLLVKLSNKVRKRENFS